MNHFHVSTALPVPLIVILGVRIPLLSKQNVTAGQILPLTAKYEWERGCSYGRSEREGVIFFWSNSFVKNHYKNHAVATSAI